MLRSPTARPPWFALIVCHLLVAEQAFAQEPGDATTQRNTLPTAEPTPSPSKEEAKISQLEDIVVTARKITERLQDIPMSISVVTSDELEKTGALNLQDLGREVPGLNVVSGGPGQNQITLRGLTGNNTVALYVDDTPLSILNSQVAPDNWFMDPALFDLQRVEVLKGPQGTLYGSSSLGGTVRYITNQPDLSQTHVIVKATGSYTDGGGPNEELDALVNQPLIPGYVAVRAMATSAFMTDTLTAIRRLRTIISPFSQGPSTRTSTRSIPTVGESL